MNESDFVARREADWQDLKRLCDRGEASLRSLATHDFERLFRLYREVSADLARVRTHSANEGLEHDLNALVARAYGIVYRRRRQRTVEAWRDALATVADTVRRRTTYVLAALGLFLAGAGFGAATMEARPDLRPYLIPATIEPVFESWRTGVHDERDGSEALGMMGFYATNNPMVSIYAASLAAGTFGLGTALLLWNNGVLLGTLGQDVAEVGHLDHLLVSIAPHGATELTGIFMAWASGLLLGAALVFPGRRSRGEALRRNGRDAFVLMALAVAMMFIAAPFEAFFSFNPRVPDAAKAALAAVVFAAWMAFFAGYGRRPGGGGTVSSG